MFLCFRVRHNPSQPSRHDTFSNRADRGWSSRGKIETLPLGKIAYEYLGIPYAEPPVGDLRFAAPVPSKPWSDVRDATSYGKACPRPSMPVPVSGFEPEPESEDCLFLNVFVPSTIKPDDKLAVMVWIHGGGFSYGSSTEYPAGILAAFNDVIVVSMNYRLGILGFFNIPDTEIKGNYGMLDQILALQWVQTNIASFGGDPNRVTLFGQSAGAIAVSLQLLSPLSQGLFQRVIIESGPASYPLYSGEVKDTKHLEMFAELVNCSLGPQLISCVRGKAVEDILSAQSQIIYPMYVAPQDLAGPVVDGEFLPDLPNKLLKDGNFHQDVDIMIGTTSNEGALFATLPPDQIQNGVQRQVFESKIKDSVVFVRGRSALAEEAVLHEYTDHDDPENILTIRRSMLQCLGDKAFVAPVIQEAKAYSKEGRKPYVYLFDYCPVHSPYPEWVGVSHGMELGLVFGAPFKTLSWFLTMLTPKYSEAEKEFSLYIMEVWTNFAKNGSPNPLESASSLVTWPQYTEDEQAYLVLDLKPRVEYRYKADKVVFWNDVFPKLIQEGQKNAAETENETLKDEL
ncbi:neurexin protein binding [Desmophyllum pertusum]|uniref:Carboxylic ester hydrolase n=1 Tax=Desmophyllum pertusum TaxID=174260 RepID=A0A9X0A4A1_9CNID|nr:neurexin protein binding [Desmophyllum pertusum]